MDHTVRLKRAGIEDKELLRHLWDLYSYDFSVYDYDDTQSDGRYLFYYDDGFFKSDDRSVYFIMAGEKYAGFVSVSNNCYILNQPDDKCILDFFVMNKFRKGGVGKRAAYLVFDLYPTRFEVAQYDNNEVSKTFWERIISEYTGSHFEIRKVFTSKSTLQAIIFDASSRENTRTIIDRLNHQDTLSRIKLYARPAGDDLHRILDALPENMRAQEAFLRNLRMDMEYQNVLTVEDDTDGVVSFVVYTSLGGSLSMTYFYFDYGRQDCSEHLVQALKTLALQNGFDSLSVHTCGSFPAQQDIDFLMTCSFMLHSGQMTHELT